MDDKEKGEVVNLPFSAIGGGSTLGELREVLCSRFGRSAHISICSGAYGEPWEVSVYAGGQEIKKVCQHGKLNIVDAVRELLSPDA